MKRSLWTRDFELFANGYNYEDLTGPGVYVLFNLATGDRYVGSAKNVSKRMRAHRDRAWLPHSDAKHKRLYSFILETDPSDWVCVIDSMHETKSQAEIRETELVLKYERTCPELLLNVKHPLTQLWLNTPRARAASAELVRSVRIQRAAKRLQNKLLGLTYLDAKHLVLEAGHRSVNLSAAE